MRNSTGNLQLSVHVHIIETIIVYAILQESKNRETFDYMRIVVAPKNDEREKMGEMNI